MAALHVASPTSEFHGKPRAALRRFGLDAEHDRGALEYRVKNIKKNNVDAGAVLAHAAASAPPSSTILSASTQPTNPILSPRSGRKAALKEGRDMLLQKSVVSGSEDAVSKKMHAAGLGSRAISALVSGKFGVDVSYTSIWRAAKNPTESPKAPGRPNRLTGEAEKVIFEYITPLRGFKLKVMLDTVLAMGSPLPMSWTQHLSPKR